MALCMLLPHRAEANGTLLTRSPIKSPSDKTRLRSMPLAFPVEDWPPLPRRPFASACPKGCVDRCGQHPRHGLALHQNLLFSAMLPPSSAL